MLEVRIDKEIEELLIKSDALLTGHFILSSGLHSDKYVQCAKFFQYPKYSEIAALKLKEKFKDTRIDVVIGGAFGGIILAYEIARAFNVKGIFAERVNNIFELRRGFEIKDGENVLIAEDVITTSKSIGEVAELLKNFNCNIVGVASLIDRNMKESENFPYRIEWLHTVKAEAFKPEECPLCKENKIKAIKPGSRNI